MRKIPFLILAALTVLDGTAAAAEPRQTVDLDGPWQAVESTVSAERPPVEGWRAFSVPGLIPSAGQGGARTAWFRREVQVRADWTGQRIFVRLAGARWDARVWIDGHFAGGRLEGFTPLEIEVTALVTPGKTHRLLLRCQDWTATFSEPFELKKDASWDELRGQPQARILAPIGGHFTQFGPWDSITLQCRPALAAEDVAVIPSFRNGTLTVRGRISDARSACRVEAEVLDQGRIALTLPGTAADPGGWALTAKFPGVRPWSPEDPFLYLLRVTVRDVQGGAILDRQEIQFGFRELWAQGPDLYLNGVKRHFLATSCWPPVQAITREQIDIILRQVKDGNNIAMRLHTQPWREMWLEAADKIGVMIVDEGALWCDSGGGYAYQDERFWENVRGMTRRMVERDRNHAALVMWSLENELLHCGGAQYAPDLEKRLGDLARFVRTIDPSHPITFEADLDPDGAADVIGLHYPHELIPYTDYPNTCDWLDSETLTGTAGGVMGSRMKAFRWDRQKPLYIGEYLWVPSGKPWPGTVFFGDNAYADVSGYHMKAKGLAWFDQTLAYRRAGVSGLCPWTIFEDRRAGSRFPLDLVPEENSLYQQQKAAYAPLSVFIREKTTRFIAGQRARFHADIFNDTPLSRTVEFDWNAGSGMGRGRKTLTLEPGEFRSEEIVFRIPRLKRVQKFKLIATLSEPDPKAKEKMKKRERYIPPVVSQTVLACQGEPIHGLSAPTKSTLLVFDPSPDKPFTSVLKKQGLKFIGIPTLEKLSSAAAPKTILIIAPGALGRGAETQGTPVVGARDPSGEAFAGFLRRGGKAIVLEQGSLASLPLGLSLVPHTSTMTFPTDPRHPLMARLRSGDLSFWTPGHTVTRQETHRPERGGARSMLVSGGPNGLDQAPLLDLPCGAGRVLVCQALVGEKLGTEPSAGILFQNMLNLLGKPVKPANPATVISDDPAFHAVLERLGVEFNTLEAPLETADLAGVRLVILHGGGDLVESSVPALASWTRGGGTVYWHAPDPETFGRVRTLLGARSVNISPASGPIALQGSGDPVLSGITREDVAFVKKTAGWNRPDDPDPAVIAQALAPELPAGGSSDRIEAGTLTLSGTYVSADKGRVTFATHGTASGSFQVKQKGHYALTLMASGAPAAGVWPMAELSVDGQVVAQLSVTSREAAAYTVLADLKAGKHAFTIAFVNDGMAGTEDRNLMVDALLVGRKPWKSKGVRFLSSPAALAAIDVGKGRLVVDNVRWDTTEANTVRGGRYAGGLLANLGARFTAPALPPQWIASGSFQPAGGIGRWKSDQEVSLFSPGEVSAVFQCETAGAYEIVVKGHGTPAQGVYAVAEIWVDGKKAGEAELKSPQSKDFKAGAVALSAGSHTLSVKFFNDLYVPPKEDRNLFFSAIGFRALSDSEDEDH